MGVVGGGGGGSGEGEGSGDGGGGGDSGGGLGGGGEGGGGLGGGGDSGGGLGGGGEGGGGLGGGGEGGGGLGDGGGGLGDVCRARRRRGASEGGPWPLSSRAAASKPARGAAAAPLAAYAYAASLPGYHPHGEGHAAPRCATHHPFYQTSLRPGPLEGAAHKRTPAAQPNSRAEFVGALSQAAPSEHDVGRVPTSHDRARLG